MKNFYISLSFLFLCIFSNSQNNDYANRVEHIFEHINPNKVTTGFLQDYGILFANMEAANGLLTIDNEVNK